jgi:hypothetical protein
MTHRKFYVIRMVVVAVVSALSAMACFADSQVRIVRLSSLEGDVRIDRNTGAGFEKAYLNLPITQGVKLQTGTDGRAEVEFEDGSTLRITAGSLVEFPELALRDSGAKLSNIKLQQGTAYVDFRNGKDDEFTLNFGRQTVTLKDSAHFRVQLTDVDATVAVFKGDLKIAGDSGNFDLGKNQSATFDLGNHDQYEITNRMEEAPFDDWDKEQGKYHDKYLAKNYNDYSPNAYGVSDLNYYGSFFNAPGYGLLWQPYFTSAGWDPFMDGAWAWYPGYGYAWVSGYPWGWTPYHCGSWLFQQSFGWAWQPGGCGSWARFPQVVNAPQRFRVPQPPAGSPGRFTIVTNPKPIVSAIREPNSKMIIRSNSAGLGIPRGSVRNIPRLSNQVQQNGSATTSFRSAARVGTPVPSSTMTPTMRGAPSTPQTTAAPRSTQAPVSRTTSPGPSVSSRPTTSSPHGSAPRSPTPK